MSAKAPSPQERSAAARARLLAAASELFYAEGVQSVGINRVIEHAGVAKATLYSAFGSKDGLVRAYLQARHAATAERMARELEARYDTPKERLVGAFEVQSLSFTEPEFRGCAFVSASADAPPAVSSNTPRRTTAPGCTSCSTTSPSRPARRTRSHSPDQLVLLYDSAGISAWMDRDPSAETAARTIAAALVDAAIPA